MCAELLFANQARKAALSRGECAEARVAEAAANGLLDELAARLRRGGEPSAGRGCRDSGGRAPGRWVRGGRGAGVAGTEPLLRR
ncbi:hypothetical protein GCM10025787_03610 [Saccharopolyspora rosea]